MKVNAKLNNLRIAPRKVRIVTELIKGLDVNEAFVQLDKTIKRSSDPIVKLVKSAVANAENNFGLDKNNLYILDIQVGEGPILKRWMPRAYGRATAILKRTSHISLVLEERVEGKNRKSKEEMEKEKKAREKAAKKEAKVAATEGKEKTEENVEDKKDEVIKDANREHKAVEGKRKQSRETGWGKKIFRRKSS